ncbi:MAG: hypothetical protein K1000chlam1_01247 [Candidatus Anoxychlamydiales bacterium]|nr:hypothetical protein [Candidatus Anoxychlamydiales bacterium]
MSKSKDFEKLIANIYTDLSPHAIVTHDDKIFEENSQSYRQIDVSIKYLIDGREYLTIVEARDHKRPQDITTIDAFASKITGVGATKGILICNSGFTKTAKTKATTLRIDLCSAHEAQSKNWNQEIKIPFLWTDLSPEIYITGKIDLQKGDSVPTFISKMIFSNDKGKTRLCLLKSFVRLWNQNLISKALKKQLTIKPSQENLEILTIQNEFRTVENLQINYRIHRRSWLKYFPASDYRGIQDFVTKDFQPVRLKVGPVPLIKDESWIEIPDPDILPCKCHVLISTEKHIEERSFGQPSGAQFALLEEF